MFLNLSAAAAKVGWTSAAQWVSLFCLLAPNFNDTLLHHFWPAFCGLSILNLIRYDGVKSLIHIGNVCGRLPGDGAVAGGDEVEARAGEMPYEQGVPYMETVYGTREEVQAEDAPLRKGLMWLQKGKLFSRYVTTRSHKLPWIPWLPVKRDEAPDCSNSIWCRHTPVNTSASPALLSLSHPSNLLSIFPVSIVVFVIIITSLHLVNLFTRLWHTPVGILCKDKQQN